MGMHIKKRRPQGFLFGSDFEPSYSLLVTLILIATPSVRQAFSTSTSISASRGWFAAVFAAFMSQAPPSWRQKRLRSLCFSFYAPQLINSANVSKTELRGNNESILERGC